MQNFWIGVNHRSITQNANTLQHIATHCNTLQHNATHCNTLQHIATQCNTCGSNEICSISGLVRMTEASRRMSRRELIGVSPSSTCVLQCVLHCAFSVCCSVCCGVFSVCVAVCVAVWVVSAPPSHRCVAVQHLRVVCVAVCQRVEWRGLKVRGGNLIHRKCVFFIFKRQSI